MQRPTWHSGQHVVTFSLLITSLCMRTDMTYCCPIFLPVIGGTTAELLFKKCLFIKFVAAKCLKCSSFYQV